MKLLWFLFCFLFLVLVEGASREKVNSQSTRTLTVRVTGTRKAVHPRKVSKTMVQNLVHLDEGQDGIRLQESADTIYGTTKTRVKQLYHEVPVFGYGVTVETDDRGDTTGQAQGCLLRGIDAEVDSVIPTIKPEDALQSLISIYTPEIDLKLVQNFKSTLGITDVNGKAYLVYKLSYFVYPNQEWIVTNPHAYVDAHTAVVLDHWQGLRNIQVNGVVGNQKTGVPRIVSMNVFSAGNNTCYYYSDEVEVQDLQQATGANQFLVRGFPCHAASDTTRYDLTNGAFSPLNEAYFYSQKTHQAYMDAIGRPPLGNATLQVKILARVHYGSCYENAYWDGSSLTFGDGCDTFHPLTSIDVVAHEIGHGFTSWTSGLEYRGESGGMNEAFSDMSGEFVEFYVMSQFNRTNNFLIGSDVVKSAGGTLRSMENPVQPSISHYSQYRDDLDVHYSSGVYNRAFVLLTKTSGWGITKAFQVMARANMVQWQPRSTMHCGVCGVQTAANDLGYSSADVSAAFAAVGLDCARC